MLARTCICTISKRAFRIRRTRSSVVSHRQLCLPGTVVTRPTLAKPTTTSIRWHGGPPPSPDTPHIIITFIDPKLPPDEQTKSVQAYVGETLLRVAHRNEIDLEGACEGVCACSTCHVILRPDLYSSLPDPSEDEEDMLDMAFGLTDTSRLGCQIEVTADMEGEVIRLPTATRNFYVDGHVPKPH